MKMETGIHAERDLDRVHQLLAHVEPADEMGRHADPVEAGHEEFRQAVVEHAFALDHRVLCGVAGGGIVLEILHDGPRFWAFVENLRLAFIDQFAARHGDPDRLGAGPGRPRDPPAIGDRLPRGKKPCNRASWVLLEGGWRAYLC
jgi:hypothetical protein